MNNADLYDFTSEENQGKWKGVLINALKKVLDQVHPKMYARDDALDYIERLCLRLLAMLCAKPSPHTVQDVECRVQSTFPTPIDIWALRDAREALEKGKKRSVLPVDKIHNMLQKDVLLYKIDSQVSLFLVAVLEYISADILKLAGNYVKNIKRLEITYQDVQISMNADKALMDMFYQDHDANPTDLTSTNPPCSSPPFTQTHLNNTFQPPTTATPLHMDSTMRYEDAVRELMASERAYLRELHMLVYVFREELVKLGAAPWDLDFVFSCLGDICELTVTLLGSLEDAVEMAQEQQSPCVGSCLEELAEAKEFDVYVRYADDVTSAVGKETLRKLLTGPEVESKLASAGQSMRLALRYYLPSLLLTPVRHGRLYFERVSWLKGLATVKEDQEALDTAEGLLQPLHAELTKFATRAGVSAAGRYGVLPLGGGARARRQVALDKLAELSRTVEGWHEVARDVGQCCDEFVREGTLLKGTAGSSTSSRRAPSERRAYLFDGILFLCKPLQQNLTAIGQASNVLAGVVGVASGNTAGGGSIIGGGASGGGGSIVGVGASSAAGNVLSNVANVVAGVAGGGGAGDRGGAGSGVVVECRLKERFCLRKVEIIDRRDDDSATSTNTFQSSSSAQAGQSTSLTPTSSSASSHYQPSHHHSSSISSMSSINTALSSSTLSSFSPTNSNSSDTVHAFEIAPRNAHNCLLFVSSAEEKEAWLADLVMLNTRPLLDRVLDGLLADVERAHPLRLPGRDVYRFAEADCRENIVSEQPASLLGGACSPTGTTTSASGSNTSPGVPLIKGATLVKLVERLTYHVYADPQLVKTFLTTYRSFCSPPELLSLLEERFRIPELTVASAGAAMAAEGGAGGSANSATHVGNSVLGMNVMMSARDDCKRYKKEFVQPVQFRVLNVLRHWVDQHFYDFEHDAKLLEGLHTFLNSVAVGKGMRKWVDGVLKIVQRKSEPGAAQLRVIKCVFDENPPKIEWFQTQKPEEFNILTLHPLELARQLTIYEFELYKNIRPSELVGSVWTKKDKDRTSPNLLRMIKHTTDVTRWYEKNIVEAQNMEERVAIVGRILEIMGYLDELNNFNGYLAAVSAMGSASVHRLNLTFAALPQAQRRALDDYRAPDDHFKKYQEKLRSINPPCVPFLGMYLTNILHIEEGNPDHLPNTGLINFFKRRKVAEITGEIQQYQNQPYYYDVERSIRTYLETLNPFDNKPDIEISDYLYKCSLEIEPRKCKQVAKVPRRWPHISLKPPPAVKQPRAQSGSKQQKMKEQLLLQQLQREQREQKEREEKEREKLQAAQNAVTNNSDNSVFAPVMIPQGPSNTSSPTTSPTPSSPPPLCPSNIPPNAGPGSIQSWQRPSGVVPGSGGPGSPGGPHSPASPRPAIYPPINDPSASQPAPGSPGSRSQQQARHSYFRGPPAMNQVPGTPPPLPPRKPHSQRNSHSNNSPESAGGGAFVTSPMPRVMDRQLDGAPQLPPKDPSPAPPLPPRQPTQPAHPVRLNPAHTGQLHMRRHQSHREGKIGVAVPGGGGRPPAVAPPMITNSSNTSINAASVSSTNGPSTACGQPVSPVTPLLPPKSAALRNSTCAIPQQTHQFQFPSPPMRNTSAIATPLDQSQTLPTRPTTTAISTTTTINSRQSMTSTTSAASPSIIPSAAPPVVVSQQQHQVLADKQ